MPNIEKSQRSQTNEPEIRAITMPRVRGNQMILVDIGSIQTVAVTDWL